MKIIALSGGAQVWVDDCDYEALSQFVWHEKVRHDGRTSYAYRYVRLDRGVYKKLRMHNEIIKPSARETIDHRDGNGLNNCRSNLRPATKRQQGQNQRPHRTGCKASPYKGVSYSLVHGRDSLKRPWRARIRIDGVLKTIGWFSSDQAAARAYDAAAKEYFGEFACINGVAK